MRFPCVTLYPRKQSLLYFSYFATKHEYVTIFSLILLLPTFLKFPLSCLFLFCLSYLSYQLFSPCPSVKLHTRWLIRKFYEIYNNCQFHIKFLLQFLSNYNSYLISIILLITWPNPNHQMSQITCI